MHVGSFTPEGTFAAAAENMEHVARLNFTAVQLMPICEHSDAWGYNQRQLMAVHSVALRPLRYRDLSNVLQSQPCDVLGNMTRSLTGHGHGYTWQYGTPDDLRALIRRAHELGMAVIIDVVRPALSCLHLPDPPSVRAPSLHGYMPV